MPLYTWAIKGTDKEFVVVRSFGDIEVPPTEEETDGKVEGEWERIMCAPTVKKAPGFGRKGNW